VLKTENKLRYFLWQLDKRLVHEIRKMFDHFISEDINRKCDIISDRKPNI